MQITSYGQQTVSDRGVMRSCGPLKNFGNFVTVVAVSYNKIHEKTLLLVANFLVAVSLHTQHYKDDHGLTVTFGVRIGFRFNRSIGHSSFTSTTKSYSRCYIWCRTRASFAVIFRKSVVEVNPSSCLTL